MGRKLDQSTKDEIVRLNLEEGISTRVLAIRFKISRTTVQSCLRNYRKVRNNNDQNSTYKTRKKTLTPKDELVKQLKMQVDILQSFLKELERWDIQQSNIE